MRVPDPNILVVRRLLPVHVGRDLVPHVTACSECEGARACGGGGCAGPAFGPAPFLLGGVGAAKGLLPCFLVPKGNQPTACTLALWWLKFGPTETLGGGGGLIQGPTHPEFWHTHRPTNVPPPPGGGGGLTPTHPPTHPSPFMGVGQTQELWGSSVTPSASGTKHKQS